MTRTLDVAIERWPLIKPFVISRGVEYEAEVVLVTITEDGVVGQGEATPYGRYGETAEGVVAAIESARSVIEGDEQPLSALKGLGLRGAAANAVDCALIDLAAKRAGRPAWAWLGQPEPKPLPTTITVTLGAPEDMARDAVAIAAGGLVKIKLGGSDGLDVRRMEAVRAAVPHARLICDANEGWSADQLQAYCPALHRLGVEMIEQPLPAKDDRALAGLSLPIALCADESCHVADDVAGLADRYQIVNVKLDKTGGLTGALELVRAAREHRMEVMVGCMLSTSLAMAPAVIAAQGAAYVDLDAPFALAKDRDHPMVYDAGRVMPADPRLWG